MQDITKAKCSSSSIANGTEGRLIDSRDGKVYWVAKLKDGLCWMTQNLDYTGYGTAATSFASSTQNTAQYYDPGEYVYTGGSNTNSCGNQSMSTGLSGCTSNGWLNVEGMVPSSNPNQSSILDAIGEDVYLYNAHYLVGNYYNWMAATNGTAVNSGNASGSICPTGWSLPLSESSNNGNDGSFYKLLNGLKNTDITVAPYYYVYGGNVSDSALYSAGSNGYYWSATANSASNAYYLYFISSSVNPSGYNARYAGLSIRCVAR